MRIIATHPMGTSSLTLNHLQFADNTLLFSTTYHIALQNLFDVVGIFERASSLKVNFSKNELLGVHIDPY